MQKSSEQSNNRTIKRENHIKNMKKVEIRCPDCNKLITKVSEDSNVTVYGYCRRCKQEKKIIYRAKEPDAPK